MIQQSFGSNYSEVLQEDREILKNVNRQLKRIFIFFAVDIFFCFFCATIDTIFYEYEMTSNFNTENAINYFDNQRAKNSGNIGTGEYVSRNIDIENNANIIFYDYTTTEVEITGDNVLNSALNSPLNN
jgi:hypothetical protein